MTQVELIRNLSSRLGITQVETKRLLKSSVNIIKETLDKDISISILDLGTFSTVKIKNKKSYNPFHKQYFLLPPKRIIRFRPSLSIKNALKTKRIEK
ncbi:MAG: HU family DNA-binding protein [Bacteroidales bacterium]|nr:HU family DNA-binding protein [Bacteroidales bacterium]